MRDFVHIGQFKMDLEHEKLTSKRLNASKKLKQTISEAESIAISNLIEKINHHVEKSRRLKAQ